MEEEEVIKLGTYPFHIYDDSDGNSDVIGKINENLLFFIPPQKLKEYTESDCWQNYKNNMISMVKDNQIMYKTGDNQEIEIPKNGSDSDGNSDSDGVITYKHEYDYIKAFGLITFNDGSELKSLNDKMFKGKTNLTYIYLPSKCERIGDFLYLNPGSVSIPKEGSCHSYMTFDGEKFLWKNIETGEAYMEKDL